MSFEARILNWNPKPLLVGSQKLPESEARVSETPEELNAKLVKEYADRFTTSEKVDAIFKRTVTDATILKPFCAIYYLIIRFVFKTKEMKEAIESDASAKKFKDSFEKLEKIVYSTAVYSKSGVNPTDISDELANEYESALDVFFEAFKTRVCNLTGSPDFINNDELGTYMHAVSHLIEQKSISQSKSSEKEIANLEAQVNETKDLVESDHFRRKKLAILTKNKAFAAENEVLKGELYKKLVEKAAIDYAKKSLEDITDENVLNAYCNYAGIKEAAGNFVDRFPIPKIPSHGGAKAVTTQKEIEQVFKLAIIDANSGLEGLNFELNKYLSTDANDPVLRKLINEGYHGMVNSEINYYLEILGADLNSANTRLEEARTQKNDLITRYNTELQVFKSFNATFPENAEAASPEDIDNVFTAFNSTFNSDGSARMQGLIKAIHEINAEISKLENEASNLTDELNILTRYKGKAKDLESQHPVLWTKLKNQVESRNHGIQLDIQRKAAIKKGHVAILIQDLQEFKRNFDRAANGESLTKEESESDDETFYVRSDFNTDYQTGRTSYQFAFDQSNSGEEEDFF